MVASNPGWGSGTHGSPLEYVRVVKLPSKGTGHIGVKIYAKRSARLVELLEPLCPYYGLYHLMTGQEDVQKSPLLLQSRRLRC